MVSPDTISNKACDLVLSRILIFRLLIILIQLLFIPKMKGNKPFFKKISNNAAVASQEFICTQKSLPKNQEKPA